MFQKAQLRVLDWLVFFILMAIPLVNVIMLILILLDSRANKTLQSFIKAELLVVLLIVLFLFFTWSLLIEIIDGTEDNTTTIARTMML
ncbi:MAG: hypothetical protein ACOCSM_02775 [Bacillota bacterium]